MRRSPGWIRLAGIALELGALAFLGYVLMERQRKPLDFARGRSIPHDDNDEAATPICHPDASIPQHRAASKDAEPVEARNESSTPIAFIKESADQHARYYRASDETAELIAGFYSDGRVRLADAQHRFAGMLQSGHADLLELENNQWSELFVHTTPTGRMQLELRGGPYDARVLTCDPFDKLRMTVD